MAGPPSPCAAALVLQDQSETLTLLTSADQAQTGVKVSFFGGLPIGRVACPQHQRLLTWPLAELPLSGSAMAVALQRDSRWLWQR